jgi:hypothetical protein
MRSLSDRSCRKKWKYTYFIFNNFFRKSCRLWDNVEKMWHSQRGHRWQYNMAHALCVLDNWCYRHTLRVCNTYCFFTATMVTRTPLTVTLYVPCLSCRAYHSVGVHTGLLQIRASLLFTDIMKSTYNTQHNRHHHYTDSVLHTQD